MSSSYYLRVLPQELLLEILSWVPVKDLVRFRCVSKSWNSLVFDPTFVKLHLQRSSKNSHVLLLTFEDFNNTERLYCAAPCSIHGLLENSSSTIDGCHQFNHDYIVLDVCNGLVCLRGSYRGDEFQEFRFRFWNPASRAMSEDSPPIRFRLSDYNDRYLLKLGFGYDDWSDSYKVVAIIFDIKSKKVEVRIHCMDDACWRNIVTFPGFPTLAGNGAFVSGTVNWLSLRKLLGSKYQRKTISINELVIFSYDLKNETYKYLWMPDGLFEVPPVPPPVLKVLKGCLCLCHHHGRTQFGFWLMREFGVGKSWTHLLNISYQQLHIHGSIHGFPPFPVILCMSENDDVMLLASRGCGEFVIYNKRDKRIDRYGDFDNHRFGFLSYDYVQSLVIPRRS